MGLFNSFMKGMGFSDSENEQTENVSIDDKDEKDVKYSSFENGLANTFVTNEFKAGKEMENPLPNFNAGTSNLVIYSPKDNKDIKILVECLRRREACIVNLVYLKEQDAEKILQFLSGAVYALKGSIKRLQGDLFLLAPEGVNIMTQAKN